MEDKQTAWLSEHGIALLILAVVAAAGGSVLGNGFINYDDPQVLLLPGAAGDLFPTWHNMLNGLLPGPDKSWLPLRFLLFSTVYPLAGPSAWTFHLVSLLLYAVLCLQVYRLAHHLLAWDGYSTGRSPWRLERGNFWPLAAALLFATSPLNVESLAWVSAVKDLIHGIFWMAFLLSVIDGNRLKLRGNWRALILLVLALMAKPSAMMLPMMVAGLVLLGPYDRSSLHLPRTLILAVAAILAANLLYILILIPDIVILPLEGGIQTLAAGALKVFFAYLGSFLVPVNLSVRYLVDVPLSVLEPMTLARLFTLLVLIVMVASWRRAGRLLPSLALVWYLLALLPTSGLVPLEILRADRYALTMLPVLAISLSYGLRELGRGYGGWGSRLMSAAVLLIPLCFAILFVQRVGVWSNSESLWTDTLNSDSRNWIALNGLAHVELERGDTTAAIAGYKRTLEVNPNSALALSSLATLVEKQGEVEYAAELLHRAYELRGANLKSSLNLARFYLRNGSPDKAGMVLEGKEGRGGLGADLQYLLSVIYRRTGQLDEAVVRMNAARALDPNNAQYQAELGRLLLQQGEVEDAMRELGRALDNDSELVEGYLGFGELFTVSGQPADAANAFRSALRRDPANRDALLGLAGLFGSYGQLDSAAVMLDRLLAAYPNDCNALANQVALLVATGETVRAAGPLQRAIACDSTVPQNYINGFRIYTALDSLGRAAVMLERAVNLTPASPQVEGLKSELENITGVPADTAINYLANYSRTGAGQVKAAESAALLDILRHSYR